MTPPDTESLQHIVALQPQALGYIQKNGFVMDKIGPLDEQATELDRWKVLAFSLYTDVCEAALIAENLIEEADERQAIDAGTHEPAVDDFGNQYLAPASPLPQFVNAFDYPCIEPMHKQAKRNLDAYRRKAIMTIAPKVPTGSHKPWCASLRYNMGYECNCRVANMLEGSHE